MRELGWVVARFSRNARARDDDRMPATFGSSTSGPGPRTNRSRSPGYETVRLVDEVSQISPSEVGRNSSAVRWLTRASG